MQSPRQSSEGWRISKVFGTHFIPSYGSEVRFTEVNGDGNLDILTSGVIWNKFRAVRLRSLVAVPTREDPIIWQNDDHSSWFFGDQRLAAVTHGDGDITLYLLTMFLERVGEIKYLPKTTIQAFEIRDDTMVSEKSANNPEQSPFAQQLSRAAGAKPFNFSGLPEVIASHIPWDVSLDEISVWLDE